MFKRIKIAKDLIPKQQDHEKELYNQLREKRKLVRMDGTLVGDGWCVELGGWGQLTGQLMHILDGEEARLEVLVGEEEGRLGGTDIVDSNPPGGSGWIISVRDYADN